jgi:3-deoxy-D-manno-octulosonic-acid transferase
MKTFWFYFYNLIVYPLLIVSARAASLFNEKIRSGFSDRTHLFEKLDQSLNIIDPEQSRIWFHVSSLGEFEQAKPIIQRLKSEHPEVIIIVSFFSPSGYRHSVNYKYADVITYMPYDSRRLSKKFIHSIKPNAAVFIRYDIWPNHIWTLAEAGIPFFLSSATLREKSVRLMPGLRAFHRHLFNLFTAVLTVTEYDARQFKRFGLQHPVIGEAGDTRYDQVLQRSKAAQEIELLPPGFTRRKKVFVIGSSWNSDEEHLIPTLKKLYHDERNLLTILVPHEPSEQNLERIEKQLEPEISNIRFSHINNYNNEKLIIVDSIGILVTLYKYAHVAYIGGGFKSSVHNVLEAAVYGIPVVFGPKHNNSQEAVELARRNGGFVVIDRQSMHAILQRLLTDSRFRKQAGTICRQLVKENAGATGRILKQVRKYITVNR